MTVSLEHLMPQIMILRGRHSQKLTLEAHNFHKAAAYGLDGTALLYK